MYHSAVFKNHSIIPALVLFGFLFAVGAYAGTAFAAMVNSGTSISVSAQTSNGGNGASGAAGSNGADGADGANGKASASVKIKTVVNGKVVQDIDERRESSNGEGISVEVQGDKVTWSASVPSSKASSSSVAVGNRSVVRSNAADLNASEALLEIDTASTASSGGDPDPLLRAPQNRSGIYSFIKSFFHHVASFFRV